MFSDPASNPKMTPDRARAPIIAIVLAMTVDAETASGRVRGQARAASAAFLGIPYADAPVGAGRFAAPLPRTPWSDVRDATRPGAIAMQGAAFAPGVGAEGTESEDCLTLNVYTPACDGARRPVLFFVHGGAFTVGTACLPLYDGRALAETHDVVVVSANYRLGALGYLAPGAEGGALSAVPNAGLLDVVAALRWVRDNVERFGGARDCVTVFGESAGASLVTMLLAHVPARGLFHRAIAESAMDPLRLSSSEAGTRSVKALLTVLGLGWSDLARLRDLPLSTLKAAQAQVEAERASWPHFYPVQDARSLPLAPADAVLLNDAPRVPLIIGYNRDEWNLFDAANVAEWSRPFADEDAIASLTRRLAERGHAAATLFDVYRSSRRDRGLPHDARAITRAITGDLRFRIGSQEMAARYAAREPRTYCYVFTHGSPGLRGALGACHALELPFVFGTLDSPNQDRFAGTGEKVTALSRAMMTAWVRFARTGIPEPSPGTPWPAYDAARRQTMVFDLHIRVEEDPFGEERRAFPL
jgi:para-nitrobenzyl esterase